MFATTTNNVTLAAQNALKNAIAATDKAAGGIKMDLFKKKDRKKEFKEDVEDDDGFEVDVHDTKMTPDEAMNHALLKVLNIMVREQNFLMDFFGIGKTNSPQQTQSEEESLETWQNGLSIPRKAFKDPKAEKRLR